MNASTTCARSTASGLTTTARMMSGETGAARSRRSRRARDRPRHRRLPRAREAHHVLFVHGVDAAAADAVVRVVLQQRLPGVAQLPRKKRGVRSGCDGAGADATLGGGRATMRMSNTESGSAYDSSSVWTWAFCCFR
jgi:hypothetical protein